MPINGGGGAGIKTRVGVEVRRGVMVGFGEGVAVTKIAQLACLGVPFSGFGAVEQGGVTVQVLGKPAS